MTFDSDPSYSRLRADEIRTHKTPPKPTRVQKALELALFATFGFILALAGVALYATSRPEHQRVPNRMASGIASDRVNVLLIGTSQRIRNGGPPELNVESLMLLSIQPSTGRAALMSIPLDLWVKVGRYGPRPLRSAQLIGDANGYPGGGVGLTLETVQSIIKQPIHGYFRFSIGDVQRVVEAIGGVDLNIQRGVFEYRKRDHFHRGQHHLQGDEAMRYAYSRYIAGPAAANRFAREQRQQDVVLGAISKSIRTRNWSALETMFGPLTSTNLDRADATLLISALRRSDEVRRISFAPYLDAFDVTSVAYRGEAVRPRSGDGDFTALQTIAGAAFETGVARVH